MFKAIIKIDDTNTKIEYYETPRYIFKQTNGVIITTPDEKIADGVLSADGSVIYAFTGGNLDTPDYTYLKCNMYPISMNTYIKEMADIEKAQENSITTIDSQVTETQVAIVDIYEVADTNATQLTETQIALADVYEVTDRNSVEITEAQTALVDIYEIVATIAPTETPTV